MFKTLTQLLRRSWWIFPQTTFDVLPIKGRMTFAVMAKNILQFTQDLGHAECNSLCDSAQFIRQVQERAVRGRQPMGLATNNEIPAAYSHGNSLCENTVGCGRDRASILMRHVQEKVPTQLSTNHGLWSSVLRQSSWLLNRFAVVHGCAPLRKCARRCIKPTRQSLVNLHLPTQFLR